MLDLISAIYKDRTFSVKDATNQSATLHQAAGIAQGCPLSPYLFIIVMTVAMMDARRMSQLEETQGHIVTPDLVYADDTMLLGSSAESVQRYLDHVVAVGRTYGLELNLQKTVLLRVRGTADIFGSDGLPLKVSSDAVYLGGLVSSTGGVTAEISRRLGEGRRSFLNLAAVWKHANVTKKKKLLIFEACVVSKVLYGLESMWLLKDQLRKLDAFYCSCLRKIVGVLPAFVSRISNHAVLDRLSATLLSQTLKKRQLMLYGRLVHQPENEFSRQVAIEPGGCKPRDWHPNRKVGRPCQRWPKCVYDMGLDAFNGNVLEFHNHLKAPGPSHWRSVVSNMTLSS